VATRAMHIAVGRRVFLLAGIAKPEAFAEADKAFEASLQSFRELTSREASALRPNVVALYTALQGDSWESIAARHGHLARAATLAIMNGHAVNDQPAPGEALKVVVVESDDRKALGSGRGRSVGS
jgi:predicted Zn-dependent protease